MKKFIYFMIVIFMAYLVGAIAYAEMVIDIEAHIDGRDQLIINRNTLQWHHFDFAAVGRHIGANSPTIIYTTESGSIESGWEWLPDWPALPPDEIRFEAFSSVFNDLTPGFPTDGVPWSVTTLLGRGEVNIIEQPSAGNDFTMVVEIDDNPFGGSRFYGIRLSPVSEPPDSDGDGIPDDEDSCPESDLSTTVLIDDCNSEVDNTFFEYGCTISDLISECADGAVNHGNFVSCVAHLTNDLKKDGVITGSEKDAIQSCAGQADIP